MSTKANEAARADAQAKLREWLKPGDTVYTILRHVSRSGMSRTIGVVLLQPDDRGANRPLVDLHPNWLVSQAVGLRMSAKDRDGVVVGGCGMDMGFHLVYETSHALFPDGFGCIGEGCPSNDHSNGDRDYMPHGSARACYPEPLSADSLCHCIDALHWHGECAGTEPACKASHWHRDGGYALRQRWL